MANNKGYLTASKNDELYTPAYAINPLIEFIRQKGYQKIWSPFDTEDSQFVKVLRDNGFNVRATHKDVGADFFSPNTQLLSLDFADIIISNPPYSIKDEILTELYGFHKPFAMLLPLPTLQGKGRWDLFSTYGLELLIFDSRISFAGNQPPMATVYFCKDLLPEKLVFRKLEKEIQHG